MGNVFNTPEQREHWNKYNNDYSKKNYRTVTIKLNKKEYAEEIAYLEQDPKGISHAVKVLLKEKISGGK